MHFCRVCERKCRGRLPAAETGTGHPYRQQQPAGIAQVPATPHAVRLYRRRNKTPDCQPCAVVSAHVPVWLQCRESPPRFRRHFARGRRHPCSLRQRSQFGCHGWPALHETGRTIRDPFRTGVSQANSGISVRPYQSRGRQNRSHCRADREWETSHDPENGRSVYLHRYR